MKTPTTLIIMDGYGLSDNKTGNAVSAAETPVLDSLFREYPHSRLNCSGHDVGLPDNTMGNSEVGHTNIGAGRVVYQSFLRISNAIKDGSYFRNPVYCAEAEHLKKNHGKAHLFILLSDAGVHSHLDHLWAMLELLRSYDVSNVYIHCFMDGRDTSPTSGADYLRECAHKCAELGIGHIASVTGRFYAMDRDKRWERVESAYCALTLGEGIFAPDPVKAAEESYKAGITDEFIKPHIVLQDGIINSGDTVFFLNFRPDRARELTRAFTEPKFDGFARGAALDLRFVCATQYDETLTNVKIAFGPVFPEMTFGEFISKMGMTQLRISETEKYAHITFFFNGGVEKTFPGEDRILIPSSKEFPTYDLIPKMRAYDIAETVCEKLADGIYDVIILNFANCDMVGHTGNFEASVKAVETVDACVGMVIDAAKESGGIVIVTADHGNAEQMLEDDGVTAFTPHTMNKVPFIICGADVELNDGRLCDIAPTMLDLMGLEKPTEMTGVSLIK